MITGDNKLVARHTGQVVGLGEAKVFMATSANFGNMFSMAGASLFLPFLPMLPKQILLINFLTDLLEMTIAADRVDDVFVERPHRYGYQFHSPLYADLWPAQFAF